MMHVEHWMHVWFANLFGIGLEWGTRLLKWNGWGNFLRIALPTWLRLAGRALWAMAAGLTLRKSRLVGAINLVGSGCEIHHTAVVEASILGDGVKVGPHAVVRASILGDGVGIGDHSIVNASVMGAKSTTCTQGIFGMCMCWPEAFTGRMQMVVQG
ncbi:MAG: hypothetical protein K8I02_03155, partial [Candidatus Methylomirabilis sp.]|nr:hypothetical protein [Deltaproteobacteria bacterium]